MRLRAALFAGLAALAAAAPAQADTWTVTNGSSDATTPACNVDTHQCVSLRTALAASEATKEVPDTINVPSGTININNDLVIQSAITVVGTSARTNIIDGGGKYRGFRVTSTGNAEISHFTVRNGAAGQGDSQDGGGILNNGGVVALDNVRVTASRADNGGGIANVRGNLLLQRSLVDNNTATGDGGGIAGIGGPEVPDQDFLLISDSTVFRNTGGLGGVGGVSSRNAGSLASLVRVTVADNSGGARGVGGIARVNNGTLQIGSSIVARNLVGTVSTNCGGTLAVTDAGANVENDKECDFDVTGATNAVAAALSNQGGELDVLAITAASPAVDRGPLSACNAAGTTDQRLRPRPQGTGCDSGAFELDVAPTVTINSGPTGTINVPTASFTFSTPEPGVTYQCRLTGPGQSGVFVPCDKPGEHGYGGLASGSYTFSVRALDGVFTDPPTTSRAFTVVLLDTTITGGPSGATNDTTPTFTFTGVGGAAGFQCSVDGAPFVGCTSPHTTVALTQGPHTFQVRALSASGAPDPTPAERSITVDSVAPDTTLTPIATPTGDQTPTFMFASEPGVTFRCRVDAAAFAPCASPHTTAVLGDGAHTFEVRAVDAAGNADPTPASQAFVVDAGAPDTTKGVGPEAVSNDATPTFVFASDEAGSTFACSLDGAAFTACGSPLTLPAVAEGAHTFAVRARDASGNEDATPATWAFTVDLTPPAAPEVVSGPSGPTTDSAPAFGFAATETVTCRLEGPVTRGFETCASPKGFGELPPGDYVFVLRAVDAAGNANETRRAFTVTAPQQAQPTPTPSPTATPTPTPTPSAQSVVVAPAAGTILVRLPGARTFAPLDTSLGIPFGSEVDARKGRVTLTALPTAGKPPETADFYDGIFTVHKVGGFIEVRLSEKLTGCPKARKSTASAAQKKPKSRKLWGSGKGKFRTRGQYSSATVRGTTWLVQDTCTTTLTRVTQGVVAVNDFVKRKTILVKKGKRYTARPKRR